MSFRTVTPISINQLRYDELLPFPNVCLHVVVLSLRVSSFFPFFCFVLYCVGFVFTVFIFFSRFPSSASGGLEVAWSFTLCGSNFFCASFLRGVGIDFFHVRSTRLGYT